MPLTRISSTAIGADSITSAKLAHDLDLDGDFVRVPHGTTAQRPSSPVAGYMRFNTDLGTLEQWNTTTSSWQAIDSPPIITSLAYTGSVTAVDPAGGETITLTGTNFKAGATVTIGGTSATSVSVASSTSITFTTPAKTAGDYDVTVTNANGLAATLSNGISYNGTPSFTTAAGNVGSLLEDVAMSTITIVAAEPDGGTLAYSITSGALPTGVSLGSANGQLTGTPNVNVTSNTTYNFTVTATDDESQTNSRAFNLIVLRPIYATQINNSLRFGSDRSAMLQRTPSSDSNRKTLTWSGWVKRSKLGAYQNLFTAEGDGGGESAAIRFDSSDRLDVMFLTDGSDSVTGRLITNAKFRDVSAWLHIVYAQDTTSSTAGNRMRLYVNGSEITSFATDTNPTQNHDGQFNAAVIHRLGAESHAGNQELDGYMADVHLIDGQALAPTSFAEEYYGVWAPKTYSGSYGTNGFKLAFGTANAVGDDTSGNTNDWTASGFQYSSVIGSDGLYSSSGRVENIFDGDTSTVANTTASTDNFIQWTAPTPINYTSSVEVYVYAPNGYSITNYYSLNGGSETTFVGGGSNFNSHAWITLSSSAGTLNSIKIRLVRSGSNAQASLAAIRVDGSILTGSSYLGSNIDQVPDSPTNNFATFSYNNFPVMTFAEGALKITTTSNNTTVWGTQSIPNTGKWYFEMEATNYVTGGGSWNGLGYNTSLGDNELDQGGIRIATYYGGIYVNNSVQSGGYGNTGNGVDQTADGDVYSLAIDMDNQLFYIAKNGTWYNSADPSAGTGGLDISANITAKGTKPYVPVVGRGGSHNETHTWNFGQDSTFAGGRSATSNADANGVGEFAYTVPTNFLSLCSKNLAESTINTSLDDRPEDYFNTVTYTGNGTSQSVTVGFQPDFTWIKARGGTYDHQILDTVRGYGTKLLYTNLANVEDTSNPARVTQDSNGFTTGNAGQVNANGQTYVAWNWKAGGTPTATNSAGAGNVPTSGSVMVNGVASTAALAGSNPAKHMSVNTKSGFSVVHFTLVSGGQSIAHGLGKTPSMIILKGRDEVTQWWIWHTGLSNPAQSFIQFSNGAAGANTSAWNNTAPTSTVFHQAPYILSTGKNGIAYCFAEIEGFSKFGNYTANQSADGPFIHTGFKPAFVLIKSTNRAQEWIIVDNKRNTHNPHGASLTPDTNGGEGSGNDLDFCANGFKVKTTGGGVNYASGDTMIYAAFAADPFKYSEAE